MIDSKVIRIIPIIGLLTLLAGCVATTAENSKTSSVEGRVDADKLLPVDCLLPSQLRKLGSQMTYLAPRRAIKTTALDCEIRGGEYIAYDRADYRTSLNVWLEKAQLGDAEAQTYVGEIYEKGLGLPADYKTALSWYLKASDQGYSRAQINLGYLYEKGLGVEKDPVAALNWYRRASGITDDEIEYSSAIEVKAATLAQEQNDLLRQEIKRREHEILSLQSSLKSTQQQLGDSQHQLKDSKNKLGELDLKMEGTSDALQLEILKQSYVQQQQKIQRVENRLADLRNQVNLDQKTLKRKSGDISTQKQRLVSTDRAGPTIEVFDPAFAITRGGEPTVRVRAGSKARVISGRVFAPAGLSSVIINGRSASPDSSGVFQSAVGVTDKQQRIVIQAKDKLGQTANFSFMLIPDTGTAPKALDSSQLSRVAGSIDFGRYYALVIGNNEYRHFPSLQTAITDAEHVAKILSDKYGFNTRFIRNADRYTILSALNEVKGKLTENDNLLIYYAGHGERDVNTLQGYWLPIDAEVENTANWIPNAAISDLLNTISARHILVVADSCYSGSMTSSSVARLDVQLNDAKLKKWLKVMSKTSSRTVLTSGGIAPVLDSGGGEHSVFAEAFLEELEGAQGVVDAYKIYLSVSQKVEKNSARIGFLQNPTYAPIKFTGHSGGEFVFVKM
jgi:hypothetical protein